MDDYMRGGGGGVGGAGPLSTHHHHGGPMTTHYGYGQQQPKAHQVVKAATAVTAGGSLLLLSGLTLAGTVIALTIATPLLVIFSPVLVPAAITIVLLIGGFLASGGFGIAAVSVMAWIYRFMTGGHPLGADQLEHARMKLAGKAKDVRDTARDQFGGGGGGHHHVGGGGGAQYQTTTTTTSA